MATQMSNANALSLIQPAAFLIRSFTPASPTHSCKAMVARRRCCVTDQPHPILLLRANVLGIRAETIATVHPKVAVGSSAGFNAERPKKLGRGTWAMRHDRQLIALAKTHSLQGIADRLGRPIATIVRRAARLGVSIQEQDGSRPR
jgi:hypothetical protein